MSIGIILIGLVAAFLAFRFIAGMVKFVVLAACAAKGMKKGHTTADGLWTLTEVECLGACANAPMVQINDDNYEDLTVDSMTAILDALADGKHPRIGPQIDRQTSAPEGGPSSLKKMAERNYDYRSQW